MQTFFHQLTNPKIKNYLILIGIIILSLQALFFIYLYSVNVPFWDEWETVPTFDPLFNNEISWLELFFAQHNEHRMFFPNLIILANGILTNWNVVAQMYFSWILIGLSLVAVFLLLKKIDSKFVWLMIPISFLMYSPLQYENLLWGHQIQWFIVITCFLWVVYLINNEKLSFLLIAIGLSFVASFSLVLGLLIWPIGFIGLVFLQKNKKKFLSLWLIGSILTFILYFYNFSVPSHHPIVISSSNFGEYVGYVFAYMSSAFVMPNIQLIVVTGFILILIIGVGTLLYLIKKKTESHKIIPFIQLALFGIFSALFTGIGRQSFGIEQALSSKYVTISNMIGISAIVFLFLIMFLLVERYKTKKARISIFSFFSIILIFGIIGMNFSYSVGWEAGEKTFRTRDASLACFSLPLNSNWCNYLYPSTELVIERSNILLKYNLGPFAYLDQNFIKGDDPYFENNNWINLQEQRGMGFIETVNDKKIHDSKMFIEEPTIKITGWILDENKKTVDSIYLSIDNEPLLRLDYFPRLPHFENPKSEEEYVKDAMKYLWNQRRDLQVHFQEVENDEYDRFHNWISKQDPFPLSDIFSGNFKPRPDVVANLGSSTSLNSGWDIEFLSEYLEEGCHSISVAHVKNNTKFIVSTPTEICKN